MKYSLITMKPNVTRKYFYSELLDTTLRVWISMKARKCIMKAGSFDNYILNTKPHRIDSRFGLYVRGLMMQKKRNPDEFELPYIPGQAQIRKKKNHRWWSYRNLNPIYMPAHVKV